MITSNFIADDARRAFDVLSSGGIAILPMDVGYSLIGGSAEALKRIFQTKGRTPSKLNAMLGHDPIARELFVLDRRGWEAYELIVHAYGLPLGAVAPCHMDHPLLSAMSPDALAMSTLEGTVCMLVNAGRFHHALCELSHRHSYPLFGSSANRSLHGTKFRIEDIEPEVRAIADIVIDHGLRKYHLYQASSTLLDLTRFEVLRKGACYELIVDVLDRHLGIQLEAAPAS